MDDGDYYHNVYDAPDESFSQPSFFQGNKINKSAMIKEEGEEEGLIGTNRRKTNDEGRARGNRNTIHSGPVDA